MQDAGNSSSEPLGSSVCDVCQGLGDMNNPRSVLIPVPNCSDYKYWYTYIHHATPKALIASTNAGCLTCKAVGESYFGPMVKEVARKESENIEQRVTNECAQTSSGAHIAQSDEEVIKAIQLAELVGRERLSSTRDFAIHSPGRIIVDGPWFCWTKSDLAGNARVDLHTFVSPPDDSPESLRTTASSFFGSVRFLFTPRDLIDPNLEHRPSKDLLSEPHIDLINRWRHKCEAEHTSCRRTAYNQLLPSRVLELLDPSNNEKGVRLIETGYQMQGTYACLSYCWGSSKTQIGQTTRGNLSGYLKYIPFDELAPTVIDAILLCFKLGFRFLWVDRLCIVQDDPKDWSEEASRMHDIYSRSALTVSVPLCKDSSQSFLAERRKGFQKENEFHIIKHTGEGSKPRSSVWVYERYSDCTGNGPWVLENNWRDFCDGWGYHGVNPRNRWLERGWTYQEWMLSPRVLHIDSMTLWDCFGGYANELNGRYMEEPYLIRDPEEIEKDSGLTWREIVEEYSRRKITREEDRLPALAGLAARHAQATGDTYLAGLWRENLHWWLLWEPKPQDDPREQSVPNRHAPSWSWASLGREVEFRDPSLMFETDASFVSVFCQYDPPGSLTTVQKAWIDIECGISVVKGQTGEKDGDVCVKAAGRLWRAKPDHGLKYPADLIARGKIYMLHLQQDLWKCPALVLQEHGWEDGRRCFQRIGRARWLGYRPGDEAWEDLEDLPVWKKRHIRENLPAHADMRQIVRLV